MKIETFKTEVATSTDLDLTVLYEALRTMRVAAVHMTATWAMIADMVNATSAEMTRRGLRLPSAEWADSTYDAAFERALVTLTGCHVPQSVEERLEGDFE